MKGCWATSLGIALVLWAAGAKARAKRESEVFQGASALTLDAKGRMSIPAKHRDALTIQCEGRVTLTKHPHGCLLLFPRPVWESHREQIAAWPMSARAWQRIFLGNACDVELDSVGRILIAPELRTAKRSPATPLKNASPLVAP